MRELLLEAQKDGCGTALRIPQPSFTSESIKPEVILCDVLLSVQASGA